MADISFVPLLVLGLVIYTLTNLLRYLMNRNWNAVITLVAGWVFGVAAVWLVGATQWGVQITVGGSETLNHLSFVEKLLVGLVVISTASVVNDLKKAIDRSDSAQVPTLLGTLMTKDAPAGFDPNPNVTTTPPVATTEPIAFHDTPPTGEG